MKLIPTIRTAPRDYAAYLQTPEWRQTRDAALARAEWRCARCQRKRDLQVHHRTYQRLGCERPEDLDVLCRACHEDHHLRENVTVNTGVYLKIASDVLIECVTEGLTVVDYTEELKTRCARLKIPYNSEKIGRAVDMLNARLKGNVKALRRVWNPFAPETGDPPISKTEAVQILKSLGIKVPGRTMPSAKPVSEQAVARFAAATFVSQEILASIQRCEELERKVKADDDENMGTLSD